APSPPPDPPAHHGLGAPAQPERHETPDPVRSSAVESRFHGVRQTSRSGPGTTNAAPTAGGTLTPHHTSREPQAPHICCGNPAPSPCHSDVRGLWHLTPTRRGRGPQPPKSSGLRFASRFWRESGDWAERVGDHALAQPRAETPRALTCRGIQPAGGAAYRCTRGRRPSRFICQALRLTSQSCLV